jgi:hypothetical protein
LRLTSKQGDLHSLPLRNALAFSGLPRHKNTSQTRVLILSYPFRLAHSVFSAFRFPDFYFSQQPLAFKLVAIRSYSHLFGLFGPWKKRKRDYPEPPRRPSRP